MSRPRHPLFHSQHSGFFHVLVSALFTRAVVDGNGLLLYSKRELFKYKSGPVSFHLYCNCKLAMFCIQSLDRVGCCTLVSTISKTLKNGIISIHPVYFTLFTYASVLPRVDPPFQSVPAEATTSDSQFNTCTTILKGQPADTSAAVLAVYGPRSGWTIFLNSQFPNLTQPESDRHPIHTPQLWQP